MLAKFKRRQPPAVQRIDRLGRPYTSMMDPDLRRGHKPPNAGRRFPPEVYTREEINRLLGACSRKGPTGTRNRAMIVVLWRCGLRIAELLALEPRDLDREQGTLTVRHGKGNKRRVVGIDPAALAVLEGWLQVRATLHPMPRSAPLFCTITRGNIGHPVGESYFREALKALGWKAGIEKRVHPHGFRHTHAVELLREGYDVTIIQKQLGHNELRTTARYLDHLSPEQVIAAIRARAAPDDVDMAA